MDKVVLLIGASGEIGKATAKLLVEKSFKVYGTTTKLSASNGLENFGVKVIELDVTKEESISIFFTRKIINIYANENNIKHQKKYKGNPYIDLTKSKFIRAFFDSLLPYFYQPQMLTERIANLKTNEAIELLLVYDNSLEQLLFDLTEPIKLIWKNI